MVAPLILGLLKGAAAKKILDEMDAPEGVREAISFATDPKGYLIGRGLDYASRKMTEPPIPEDRYMNPGMYEKEPGWKKGGKVKQKTASARGDGIAQRGKTRGKIY